MAILNGMRVNGRFQDLSGNTYGWLTVVRLFDLRKGRSWWECKCKCGKVHYAPTTQLTAKGQKPSCGCARRKDLEAKFWSKVAKSDGCWVWTASTKGGGYGQLLHQGKNYTASRLSWELHFGPIPEDVNVLHDCDNPPCVRPDHLFLGTQGDNVQDMLVKGRGATGEKAGHAKLTSRQSNAVREIYGAGGYSMKEVGDMFGICAPSVWAIVHRESHADVDPSI